MMVSSSALKASFGVTSIDYGRQPPDFFCALVVLATLMIGLVQLVLLILNYVLPFCLISVILLVLAHELIVALFLLHAFLGQQFYQLLLLLLLL